MGDQIAAKIIPSKQIAYISYHGQEIPKHNAEMLLGNGFQWIASSSGHVPEEAVRSGSGGAGEPMYIGRVQVEGSLIPGKIHPSHGCIYVPFDGVEHSRTEYEVLVAPKRASWVQSRSGEEVPHDAVLGGHDQDGTPIYVGRAFHDGDLIPAKVLPSKHIAYVAYGGVEHMKHEYEVYCSGKAIWVLTCYGNTPADAVAAGHTAANEPLYVGRTQYQGSLCIGKVQPSHHTLYIPFGGAEVPLKEYEVLVESSFTVTH